jgi:hypothetical protein
LFHLEFTVLGFAILDHVEIKIVLIIPEEPLLFKFFCFQAVIAPVFASTLLSLIFPPISFKWTN